MSDWFQSEFEQLIVQLTSNSTDCKLAALNKVIDQYTASQRSVQILQGAHLARLMDCITQLLNSWVSGGLDIAALAAEALCRVLALEVEGPEAEAAALQCVRPLLQLLAGCSQPPVQGPALPATFFAASAIVRASAWPAAVEDALQRGAPRVLLQLLRPSQPQLMHVAVFALFKLRTCCADADALFLQMEESGGFLDMCCSLWGQPGVAATEGPPSEMVFSMLMDMAAVPGVQRAVASSGGLAAVVRALQGAPGAAGRLQAVLVLCRLTCHSSECQLASLKAGCVPTVVAMMECGEPAEKVHAARLAAILAQHPAAHHTFRTENVIAPLVALLRSGDESAAEQAASVAAVLAHNPAMHGHMVQGGLVPALLPVLDTGSCKAKGYALSSVLLLAMGEGRHCMALLQAGVVARLVAVARDEADQHLVEYAAAVLGQLSRCLQAQGEVVGGGAIPVLVGLLREGSPDARAHSAEALAHLASPTAARKRLIATAAVLASAGHMLGHSHPQSRYWAANLLQVLSQEQSVVGDMVLHGVCTPLVRLLARLPHPSESELLQAQAQACWVMVRLAGHPGQQAGQQLRQAGAVQLLVRLVRSVQPLAASGVRLGAQLDALEHNTHAAAMAALLALRGAGACSAMEVLEAAALQHWCGHMVRLHGLTAPDHSAGL